MFWPLVSLNSEVSTRPAKRRPENGGLRVMNSLTSWAILIVLANSLAFAELTIDNPKHLDVPEEKARVLLRLACRAIAKEFHSREQLKAEVDFRLVLGEKDERYGINEQTGGSTLYLQEWNETKFTTAAIRLAM